MLFACQTSAMETRLPLISTATEESIPEDASIPTETPTPTEIIELWQVLGEPTAPLLTLQVGFMNELFGIAVGDDGVLNYIRDGGQTWTQSENESMELYGLDILDEQFAIGCGMAAVFE